MVSIPCIALAALAEKVDRDQALELINRWLAIGLKVDCFDRYPNFK